MEVRPERVCKEGVRLGMVRKGSGRALRLRVRPVTVCRRRITAGTFHKRVVIAGTARKGSRKTLRMMVRPVTVRKEGVTSLWLIL